MPIWDAQVYEQFSDHRTRPFHDLLARVPLTDARRIVDLGCGNGVATLELAERFGPSAHVIGIDSSPQMLEQAARHDTDGRVDWQLGDINDVQLDPSIDLVVTNAALQWVDGHEVLLEEWLDQLHPGAVLAMQVPGNFDAPSHRAIAAAVRAHPRSEALLPLLRSDPVLSSSGYLEVLSRHGVADVWETTYSQVLDPEAQQDNPVLDWVRGTALRPLLAALSEAETEPFLADVARRLAEAYPRRAFGVEFAFRRIFAVVRVSGGQ